jgi:elongation factor G
VASIRQVSSRPEVRSWLGYCQKPTLNAAVRYRYDVPTRMIFLNKLDRPGASLRDSLKAIVSNGLHHHPTLLTIPVASFDDSYYRSGEPGIAGLVDLVNWNVWIWDGDGKSVVKGLPHSLEAFESREIFPTSHPLIPEIFKAREALIDALSLHSADFMDHFLSLPSSPSPYFSVPSTSVQSALRELSLKKAVLPVVCGAALRHIGTEILLNFVGDLLASPVDDQGMTLEPSHGGGAQVLAWKVGWDKQRGWMTFVRVYAGRFFDTPAGCVLGMLTCGNDRDVVSAVYFIQH